MQAGQAKEEAVSYGPVHLIPEKMRTGCSSILPAGLEQNEFSIMSEFFKMNPELKEFSIELNITRCIESGVGAGKKTSCSTGLSTMRILVNQPPENGYCKISNLGRTEADDPTNPGINTALLDIFHIECKAWTDPNAHAITKYVFKGNFPQYEC